MTFLKTHHDPYFHGHPGYGMFSLVTSFVLAGLLVLMLVATAR